MNQPAALNQAFNTKIYISASKKCFHLMQWSFSLYFLGFRMFVLLNSTKLCFSSSGRFLFRSQSYWCYLCFSLLERFTSFTIILTLFVFLFFTKILIPFTNFLLKHVFVFLDSILLHTRKKIKKCFIIFLYVLRN